jgi:hypothetical protein
MSRQGQPKSIQQGGKEREFVFEKTDKVPTSLSKDFVLSLKKSATKEYSVGTKGDSQDLKDYYFECSSDEDSSDYYESD